MICQTTGELCPTGLIFVTEGDISPRVPCSPETAERLGAAARDAETSDRCLLLIAANQIAEGHVNELDLIVGGKQ
jgi:hypothetical protein